MSKQKQPPPSSLPPQLEAWHVSGKELFERIRGWLRSRTGRIVVPIMTLLLGIILGIAGIILFGGSGASPIIVGPKTSGGDIIVEVGSSFITQLVSKNLTNSAMPGTAQNVNVNLLPGDQMVVSGEDVFTILGVQVTRPFSFTVQLYVDACELKIHIVHADISNVPVTSFAQSFESQINRQLEQKPEGLPSGFQYCTSSVRTEPAGVFITYSAIPD